MGGEFAILFLVVGFLGGEVDLGPLQIDRYDAKNRTAISYGNVYFRGDNIGTETYITHTFSQFDGKFNPIIGLSVSPGGGTWIGAGFYQQIDFHIGGQDFFAGITAAPGLYFNGSKVDLGFPQEYRSSLELGMRFDNDWQASISYDHRSNGGVTEDNFGIETLQFRISKTFN